MKFKKEWLTRKYLSQRTIYFSLGSLVLNFFVGFIKIIISAFIYSITFAFNGIYNVILGFAKNSAIKEYNNSENIDERSQKVKEAKKRNVETKSCWKLCFYNLSASVLYLILSIITTFVMPEISVYGTITAIFIATIAFSKFIVSIVGTVKTRNMDNLIIHYIKFINLSDGLISISLCQRALLSIGEATELSSLYSGIGGICFSTLAILLSLYMIFELRFIKNRKIIDIATIEEDL